MLIPMPGVGRPNLSVTKKYLADLVKPGYFLKLHNLQAHYEAIPAIGLSITGDRTRAKWLSTILPELAMSSKFQGVQISVPWGLYERGASGGGDFRNLRFLESVIDELYDAGKFVILLPLLFREFRNPDVSGLPRDDEFKFALPEDLATEFLGVTDLGDPTREHNLSPYLYAYAKGGFSSGFGYEKKMYNPKLYRRFLRFQQAVADRFRNHPGVIGAGSSESATGNNLITADVPGSIINDGYTTLTAKQAILAARHELVLKTRKMWPNKIFYQDINFPLRPGAGGNYVKTWADVMQANGCAWSTSDMGPWSVDLNDNGPGDGTESADEIGVLRRMAADFGDVINIGQLQNDGYESGSGTGGEAPAMPNAAAFTTRYGQLYQKHTGGGTGDWYPVRCQMVIVQRELAGNIWLGGQLGSAYGQTPAGVNVPSLRAYLLAQPFVEQPLPTIIT